VRVCARSVRNISAQESDNAETAADLALLRRYEPVLSYSQGELFFPTAVGPYVEQCSLWARASTGASVLVVPARGLNLEHLCQQSLAEQGRQLYLRFVEKPLGRAAYRRWRRGSHARLLGSSRFTTTGVLGRLVDAGFRASLLLRGKVPSGLVAAAETAYRRDLEAERFTYYGRVICEGGYVCLQYWFFYAMNDWRSTFHGVNDHEADWEMITVYLTGQEDDLRPAWVAFSSHDYAGDDLRRRWDDPELHLEGNHPVCFAGAGSHSGAFIPGDYVVSVDSPQLRAVVDFLRSVRDRTRRTASGPGHSGFGIPFVDYARGDGVAIGPGKEHEWNAVLIDDATPWVHAYRGLWGLDTRDRFGGERAPSGPRYERDGSVRSSWVNPLGWAGLQKVPPRDSDVRQLVAERVAALDLEMGELDALIDAERTALRRLRAQAWSLGNSLGSTRAQGESSRAALGERENVLDQTIATRARLLEERDAHLTTLGRPILQETPQAHLIKPHRPYQRDQVRRTRFLELWAVVSVPLLLASVVVALTAPPWALLTTLGIFAVVFMGIEAVSRRRLISFLITVALLLGTVVVVGGLILLFVAHWRIAVSVLIGLAAFGLLLGNLLRG
jgi:hypothetical protein